MIVDFTPAHLYLINLRKSDVKGFESFERIVLTSYLDGTLIASTLYKDGEIVAIGGAYRLSKTVCEIFLIGSDLISKYPVCSIKSMKHVLNEINKNDDILRIQAIVNGTKKQSLKMIHKLGFIFEGILHKWIDGIDYEIYSLGEV